MKNSESKVKIAITKVCHDKENCQQTMECASSANDDQIAQRPECSKNDDNISGDVILQWKVEDVVQWAAATKQFTAEVMKCLELEEIDGQVLLCLNEQDVKDFRYRLNYNIRLGELKMLWNTIFCVQQKCYEIEPGIAGDVMDCKQQPLLGYRNHYSNLETEVSHVHYINTSRQRNPLLGNVPCSSHMHDAFDSCESCIVSDEISSVSDSCAVNIPTEFFKTAVSLGYAFVVSWITSFVTVFVHERVPDMKRYPPLPDIFLDNIPHMPWAFHMCEITGTILFGIWSLVCIFHKYRMIILRRFFALAGTVLLLRCVTLLITSLSVPGTHLQCDQNDYAINQTSLSLTEAIYVRKSRAYTIWSNLGMSIQGVRTCGDYMFSGHTVVLTLLNFFITEYTPRNLYFLHTLSWLLNMFGIFFILAAHEHYSIDVFVGFYITSRLFLYYHTLANNQALMQRDSKRTRIWFPMFSYFESSIAGRIPNEYNTVLEILDPLLNLLMELKDMIMLTTRRLWLEAPDLTKSSGNCQLFVSQEAVASRQEQQYNAPNTTTTDLNYCNSDDEINKEFAQNTNG